MARFLIHGGLLYIYGYCVYFSIHHILQEMRARSKHDNPIDRRAHEYDIMTQPIAYQYGGIWLPTVYFGSSSTGCYVAASDGQVYRRQPCWITRQPARWSGPGL